MINIKDEEEQQEKPEQIEDDPDENQGILVQSFFCIRDPETGEILRQGRA